MRNPNGYGTVHKLKGNRRRPFIVKKTAGYNEKGHPIPLIIGYTKTMEEGLILLAEYNKNPWDIDAEKVTLNSLYEQWIEMRLCKFKDSTQRTLKSTYKHIEMLGDMKYKDLKSFHMQECIDNCGRGYSTQANIKKLFGHLDNFALELDVINKGYAQLTTTESVPETSKVPFTDEEIKTLWNNKDEPWVDSVLFFLYTGFRISELLDMEIENIDLVNETFKGGTKTASGKNRIVPIHPKILPLVKKRIKDKGEYLLIHKGKKMKPFTYYFFWDKMMETLGMNHTPHECRHTFRSALDSADANKKCMDLLMGHKSKEVGERVYTHKSIDELRDTIMLINY